ncbi:PREDICTED: uncharacterized protein LOC108546581 [Eufriesea mexicana]|uniref:uncharacterized protein LOC108546581 n=1 Tax=Eufriesea mexicana TaxID=516756 RepID=UPI00083BD3CE|nr:PREDICTED: uncharacterized protein LOC108546581 [Eufriesea mexicana]
MVVELERVIPKVCDAAIPKKKWHEWSIAWWTKHLTPAKRDAYRARLRYQGTKDPATRETETQRYSELRRKYTRMVSTANIQNGRQFVTEEGNNEPWVIVYKAALGKLRREEATCALRMPQGETSSWRSTAGAMLTAPVPDDDVERDTPVKRWIREDSKNAPETAESPPFSNEDIGSAIARLKRSKCPGPKQIESEVIQEAPRTIHQELLKPVNACLEWGFLPRG